MPRISCRETVRLRKKFKKSGEKKNTKAVWYSLPDLEDIIRLVKELDDASQNKTGDGVRIYFSRYPLSYNDPKKHEKNTLVFVPTFNIKGSAVHEDYISEDEVKKLSREIGDPDTELYPIGDESYNHGELCPDQCDGANVGMHS